MFEFFKNQYLEMHGIDTDLVKKEKEQKEREKREKHFLSLPVKIGMDIISGIYIVSMFFVCKDAISNGKIYYVVLHLLMVILCTTSIILTLLKKKKTEIAGAICFAIFAFLVYVSAMIF